jgi:hypothetical protein
VHRVVREARDAVTGGFDEGPALGVASFLADVSFAVELDGEAAFHATEIEHERAYGVLTAELQTVQASAAQRIPEEVFGAGLALAQLACGGDVVAVAPVRVHAAVSHGSAVFEERPRCLRKPSPQPLSRRAGRGVGVRAYRGVNSVPHSTTRLDSSQQQRKDSPMLISETQTLPFPPATLSSDDRLRFARYAEARDFCEGAQWLGRPRRGETRLTFNYARSVVRKTAAYVFPAPVTFTVPAEGDDTIANTAEQTLAALIAELDLGQLDVDCCIETSTLGDAAVKVTWDATLGRPEVAPVDPATLAVRTAPDNPRRMRQITQVYGLAEEDAVALFGLTGPLTGNGRSVPVAETWSDDRWRVEIAGQTVRDDANPYRWIPYVILPNGTRPGRGGFWGESDLVDLYDPCRELNARLSTLSRVLEVSGAPIAVLENVDGSEGISVGPGAKWELPEGARAYLLDLLSGGGVELHAQYIDLLFRTLHDLSETPRTAFGDSGRDLSGAALEVEVQPLVQKVARKRRGFDGFYRARNARLLDLLERFGGERLGGLRRTVAVWPSALPSDLDASVRNAAHLVAAGIHSRRTAVASLGGTDPEAEWGRVLEEMRAMDGEALSNVEDQ